jgi:hypothetical protein
MAAVFKIAALDPTFVEMSGGPSLGMAQCRGVRFSGFPASKRHESCPLCDRRASGIADSTGHSLSQVTRQRSRFTPQSNGQNSSGFITSPEPCGNLPASLIFHKRVTRLRSSDCADRPQAEIFAPRFRHRRNNPLACAEIRCERRLSTQLSRSRRVLRTAGMGLTGHCLSNKASGVGRFLPLRSASPGYQAFDLGDPQPPAHDPPSAPRR